jgi:DNA polymerase III gamma/tau subunit
MPMTRRRGRASALAAALPPDETQLLYSLCLHGRGELGLAPDEYAALTMVLLRLLAFKPPTEKKSSSHAAVSTMMRDFGGKIVPPRSSHWYRCRSGPALSGSPP